MASRPKEARRSSGLAERRFRAATRAWSCCKILMVPLDVFSLLEMVTVTVELGTTTGDVTMNKARRRVNSDAGGSMIDRSPLQHGDNIGFRGPLYYGDEREY